MARRVVITGAHGRLGRHLVRAVRSTGDLPIGLARPEFDVTDGEAGARIVAEHPDVVINVAAWTDVDGCANDPRRATLINAEGAARVASAAAAAGALAVQVSTNEVFDGTAAQPYRESDQPAPVNPYGLSKLLGEQLVAEVAPHHLIVRTAWLFGPDASSFPTKIRAAARAAHQRGEPLKVVRDEWGNPTWIPALAALIVRVADGIHTGILHLAGEPPTSRFEWAAAALQGARVSLQPIEMASFRRASTPPPRAVLDMTRARSLGLPVIEWMAHMDEIPAPKEITA